jgi:hypothetical protein
MKMKKCTKCGKHYLKASAHAKVCKKHAGKKHSKKAGKHAGKKHGKKAGKKSAKRGKRKTCASCKKCYYKASAHRKVCK